jgi:hypothetical protein
MQAKASYTFTLKLHGSLRCTARCRPDPFSCIFAVRVCDFGLSREVDNDGGAGRTHTKLIPFRETAPEGRSFRRFRIASCALMLLTLLRGLRSVQCVVQLQERRVGIRHCGVAGTSIRTSVHLTLKWTLLRSCPRWSQGRSRGPVGPTPRTCLMRCGRASACPSRFVFHLCILQALIRLLG